MCQDVCELCFPSRRGLITVNQASVLSQTCKLPHVRATLRHRQPGVGSIADLQTAACLRHPAGAGLLFAEPTDHVETPAFEAELQAATWAGFELAGRPSIRRTRPVL